jgi:hypothetical protein
MGGFGSTLTLTPIKSGNVRMTLTFNYNAANAGTPHGNLKLAYGTGSAPAQNAAATGTAVGDWNYGNSAASAFYTVTVSYIFALTKGTAYWFDGQFAISAATDVYNYIYGSLDEVPS